MTGKETAKIWLTEEKKINPRLSACINPVLASEKSMTKLGNILDKLNK